MDVEMRYPLVEYTTYIDQELKKTRKIDLNRAFNRWEEENHVELMTRFINEKYDGKFTDYAKFQYMIDKYNTKMESDSTTDINNIIDFIEKGGKY